MKPSRKRNPDILCDASLVSCEIIFIKKLGVTDHFFNHDHSKIPPSDKDLTWDSMGKIATCPILC